MGENTLPHPSKYLKGKTVSMGFFWSTGDIEKGDCSFKWKIDFSLAVLSFTGLISCCS